MNTTGKITSISDVEELNNGAKKLHFEIDTGDQYDNILSFNFYKSGEYVKYAEEFSTNYQVGDYVDVEFNIKCREYQGKWYTNLDCWKIQKKEGTPIDVQLEAEDSIPDSEDGLPF